MAYPYRMPRLPRTQKNSARAVVARAIAEAARSFPDIDAQPFSMDPLDARDGRLALAIHRTVLQRWLTLDYLLNLFLKKPLRNMEPPLQGVLLTAAAQLLFMDRLPAHAVVDEAVKLARMQVRPGAAGLVNAVLRRISELPDRAVRGKPWSPANDRLPLEDGYVPLRNPCLPAAGEWSDASPANELHDLEKNLAAAASHPVHLVRRWLKEHGPTKTVALCASGLRTPPVIVAMEEGWSGASAEQETGGTDKRSPRSLSVEDGESTAELPLMPLAGLAASAFDTRTTDTSGNNEHWQRTAGGITPADVSGTVSVGVGGDADSPRAALLPHAQPGFLLWQGPHSELTAFLREHPARRVQDPTSASVVAAASALTPKVILDFCAGRGTKTRQLAATFPQAAIIATDTDDDRRAVLGDSFEHQRRVRVVTINEVEAAVKTLAPPPSTAVDLLLLDVPCTNTGVLARRPEARYRFNEASLKSLVKLQRAIVEKSLPLVAPAGHLLYSTCSIDQHENQNQAQWIVERFRCELLHESLTLPGGSGASYHDGGYVALLRLPSSF